MPGYVREPILVDIRNSFMPGYVREPIIVDIRKNCTCIYDLFSAIMTSSFSIQVLLLILLSLFCVICLM